MMHRFSLFPEGKRRQMLRDCKRISTEESEAYATVADHNPDITRGGKEIYIRLPRNYRKLHLLWLFREELPFATRFEIEERWSRLYPKLSRVEKAILREDRDRLVWAYNPRFVNGRLRVLLEEALKQTGVSLRTPPKPKKSPNRIRGYRDHGVAADVSTRARREANLAWFSENKRHLEYIEEQEAMLDFATELLETEKFARMELERDETQHRGETPAGRTNLFSGS